MNDLSGSSMELNFYHGNLLEREAFSNLVAALLRLGAQFSGIGGIQTGVGIRDAPFSNVHEDNPGQSVRIGSLESLARYLQAPDVRLTHVRMRGASGISRKLDEYVIYTSISPEAAAVDRHPIAIWTEGWMFTKPLDSEYEKTTRTAGRRAYRRLLELIDIVRPSYAALTVENALECPTDLRRDPRTYAFTDFYISRSYIGADNLRGIVRLFEEAYTEPTADGVYISCYQAFNPEGRKVDSAAASYKSTEVARLIASVGPG